MNSSVERGRSPTPEPAIAATPFGFTSQPISAYNVRVKITSRRSNVAVSRSRWLAYATASAATALTGGQSVDAAIHYSGLVNAVFRPDKTRQISFPLDQPGNLITFDHNANSSFAGCRLNSGSFRIYLPGYSYVDNLALGQRVSSATHVYFIRTGHVKNGGIMAWALYGAYSLAQFLSPGPGYIGFRFDSGRGFQYGWARVNMAGGGKYKYGFKVIDYAYADPGESITAGQTSSDEPVSEKGSLGWLALGAVGLLAWRKRRSLAAH